MTDKFISNTEFWRRYMEDTYFSLLKQAANRGDSDAEEKLKNPEKALEFIRPYINIMLEYLAKKEKEENEYFGIHDEVKKK